MDKLTQAGQFVIEKAVIFTSTGNVIPIEQSIIEINIYEDIYANSMYGELVIANTIGLSVEGPIIGQEYLSLIISTPTLEDPKHKIVFDKNQLHITKVARNYVGNDTEILTMDFVTSEVIHNQRSIISRTLVGTYQDMVETLLTKDLKCKKDLYIEKCNDTKQVITNNRRPFDIISQFTKNATALTHGTPGFVFFENFKGYHFRSLQSLYAEGSRFEYYEVEENSTPGDTSTIGLSNLKINAKVTRDLATIMSFQILSNQDSITSLSAGGLSSRLITHDIVQKKYTVNDYNYLDDKSIDQQGIQRYTTKGKKKDFHIYNSGEIDDDGNRISDFIPIQFLAPTSTVKDDNGVYKNSQYEVFSNSQQKSLYIFDPRKHEVALQKRRSLFANLSMGVRIDIEVRGQTTYGAGDIITANIKAKAKVDTESDDKIDKFLRGQFLVETIHHIFSSATQEHKMYITIAKDSIEKEHEPADHAEIKPIFDGKIFSDQHFYGDVPAYDETTSTNSNAVPAQQSFQKRSLALNRLGFNPAVDTDTSF